MKKKKGFTLVELLTVIAILAVLATVSVVGYMGFTKKAQVSNDESLVTQLNTALKADEVVDGKPETPTKMLSVMEDNGFKVENLTPTTSKYNIVWNQEDNQFAFESILYSAMVLYNSKGASKNKLLEMHKKFTNEIEAPVFESKEPTPEVSNALDNIFGEDWEPKEEKAYENETSTEEKESTVEVKSEDDEISPIVRHDEVIAEKEN